MGRFVNPDNSAFQVALNSEIYVDKTGLLEYTNKVLDTKQGYICNSRPRRFGKSITADMLSAYYSKGCDSEKMFADLKIGRSEDFHKHLNKYDVIHLDIQWFLSNLGKADKIVGYITECILNELRELYPESLTEDAKILPEALSRIKEKTGKKFVVIIDEWDVLIREESANQQVQEEYINYLKGMFKGSEPTKYIQFAFLTGILPIKKLKTQSALNNFMQYTMLNAGPLETYIGFTEEEVIQLCKQYHRDFAQVKCWYDGYHLGKYHVYNPNAVVNVMLEGSFQSYWSETGTYDSIVPFIGMDFDGLRTSVLEMLSGGAVNVSVTSFKNDMVGFVNRDDVLTLLIHLGYLAYNQSRQTVTIPNEEIRQEFLTAVTVNKWNELLEFQQKSQELLDATLERDEEAVGAYIEKIHMEYASAIQYNNENSLSSVLTIAYLSSMAYYFKPIRELPTGRGFADFVFVPKMEYRRDYPALVVELKWNEKAQTAMQQIKEKQYPASIENYTGDILLVGISYDKKSKKHQCRIEEYRKDEKKPQKR